MALFRDEEPILRAGTQFEVPNGASAPVLVKAQLYECVGVYGVPAASATGNYTVFIAPPAPSVASGLLPLGDTYQVLGVTCYFNANSASGTVDVQIIPNGTADSGGTSVLTGTISTAAGANTNINGTLTTNTTNLKITSANRLVVKFGGTATGLTDCSVCIYLGRV